jgi:hypothetical protein
MCANCMVVVFAHQLLCIVVYALLMWLPAADHSCASSEACPAHMQACTNLNHLLPALTGSHYTPEEATRRRGLSLHHASYITCWEWGQQLHPAWLGRSCPPPHHFISAIPHMAPHSQGRAGQLLDLLLLLLVWKVRKGGRIINQPGWWVDAMQIRYCCGCVGHLPCWCSNSCHRWPETQLVAPHLPNVAFCIRNCQHAENRQPGRSLAVTQQTSV